MPGPLLFRAILLMYFSKKTISNDKILRPEYNLFMELSSVYRFIDSIRGIKLVRSSAFIVVVSALLLILNEYFFRIKFNVWPAVPYTIYWLIMAMAFSALILVPWQRYQEEQERLMVEAFMAGIILGLSIAVYKIIAYRELWALFNLLAEPIRTALFGLLVAWVLKEKSRTLTMNQITP